MTQAIQNKAGYKYQLKEFVSVQVISGLEIRNDLDKTSKLRENVYINKVDKQP